MRRRWLRRRLRLARLVLCAVAGVVLAFTVPASAAIHTGRDGVALIQHFEGLVLTPTPDPVGVVSICFGQTAADGPLPARATPAECRRMLRRSLAHNYEPAVRALFLPGGQLRGLFNQHRFDALASLAYNLGPGVLPRLVASRSPRVIAASMLAYNRAGGVVLAGLTRRRHAEANLFSKPMARFELWPRYEIRLVKGLERLRGHRSARAARVRSVLRVRVALRVARLRHVIHAEHDALSHARLNRLKALERRLPHATTGGPR